MGRALRSLACAGGVLAGAVAFACAAGVLAGAVAFATAATALPAVSLQTRFSPDLAGQSTTIHFGFTISQTAPLRSVLLRLPPGMGFAGSSLGLESCSAQRLAELGPEACPADSLLGGGVAHAEVLAETEVAETAKVSAVDGPQVGSRMGILFFVDGRSPVNREAILPGQLTFAGSERVSSTLAIEVPLLKAWLGGPDIGVAGFSSTIGPEGLSYYRTAHGRRVSYTPRGLSVPLRCPQRGFLVRAAFRWWGMEGQRRASTRVACPASVRARRRRAAGSHRGGPSVGVPHAPARPHAPAPPHAPAAGSHRGGPSVGVPLAADATATSNNFK
ncbi:MAG: hypothetical protein ACYCST_20510 [Acidimicrobiales bacterium]